MDGELGGLQSMGSKRVRHLTLQMLRHVNVDIDVGVDVDTDRHIDGDTVSPEGCQAGL